MTPTATPPPCRRSRATRPYRASSSPRSPARSPGRSTRAPSRAGWTPCSARPCAPSPGPAYRTAWDAANRAAHAAFLDALTTGHGDAVTIDLAPVTAQVKGELVADGVPFADRIPVSHISVKVMEYDDLGALRKGFRMLQVAGVWLPVLTVVLAATAIAVAVRRRRAVMATGLGVAAGAVLLWIAVYVCRRLTLDDLPSDIDPRAAEAVYDALTAFLRTAAWVILAIGLAAALAAWVVGRVRRTP
ncbi:hypothetical protein ACFQFR_19185 [Streptomyces goshikiensis]